ncbi:uncharacterized protein EV420DRAFT_1724005 [Desarmillaria tabescens]|uniref:F-box domain-containing protein n=1 Tax=Armillaria tabescens TaxID=1929756 RepID=A0AA39JIT4_ARMTA|nr:uncharacterized protein EV420DRAFT_1724005 [Desarmillaria tabescens]KAK0443438.1 hypothetical protein EV420DRAFT_1724005 [Desarmillaria tabescens]
MNDIDTLYNLPDDVMIYIIAFLSVPDILLLRQICKWFNALTRLHIIWTNAYKLDIISNDYPIPVDDTDLEQRTRHAYQLATRWRADPPLISASETSFTGSPLSEIKNLVGTDDLGYHARGAQVLGVVAKRHTVQWGEAEHGYRVRGEHRCGVGWRIALLHLDDDGALHEIHSFDIDLHPVTLTGDIIALIDNFSKTLIYNWKTDEQACLDEGGDMQYGHCIQVIFTALTVLVIRARSTNFYTTLPFLHGQTHSPVTSHSFGWVAGASATSSSVLIRSKIDNSWITRFDLFKLISSFLPTFTSENPCRRGTLQCTDVILWKRGTAVWIRTHDPAMAFPSEEHYGHETLMAAVFPGTLNPTARPRVREVCSNPLNNWTALDYDEELGRIALGSGFGKITIVQL